ncbi:hypothetical protein TKK_0005952 [Trichogramma kaykai]
MPSCKEVCQYQKKFEELNMPDKSSFNTAKFVFNRQFNNKTNHQNLIMDARLHYSKNLFKKNLYSHYGCVNAVEFSKDGELLISGGDDKRVLLWNVSQAIYDSGKPIEMRAQHSSNIFCLDFNSSRTKILSAGNDDQVIVHDIQTTKIVNSFIHEKAIYGLSSHPHSDSIYASACDDGRVLVYDTRGDASSPESFFCLAQYESPFHSVMFNPVDPRTLVTANSKEGCSLWDVRRPLTPLVKYGNEKNQGPSQNGMFIGFNDAGTKLLAIRRRLPPAVYSVNSPQHLCQFDQAGYYNSCTMKSCCFAGTNDEYILSGSDDFNLYMWKIPTDDTEKWVDSAHMILRGHRSIVNHVRYNKNSCVLASSGVEKIVKLWSPFPLGEKCSGGLKVEDDKNETQRKVYSHDEYIGLILRTGHVMTHDYSHECTDEDQRMMAFFDSLVQREIESWSSRESSSSNSSTEIENDNDFSDRSSSEDLIVLELSSSSPSSSTHLHVRAYIDSAANESEEHKDETEESWETPNRITQLIANRRRKLMQLAAMEASPKTIKDDKTAGSPTVFAPKSVSSPILNRSKPRKVERKSIMQKSKMQSVKDRIKTRELKEKRGNKRTLRIDSDTDSEDETHNTPSPTLFVDASQPSTSSGVVSSSFTKKYLQIKSRSASLSSSDESLVLSGAKSLNNKRREALSSNCDSEESPSTTLSPQNRKITRKTVTARRINYKRQKLENNDTEHSNITSTTRNSGQTSLAQSSDSGITSSVSTTEVQTTTTSPRSENIKIVPNKSNRNHRVYRKQRFKISYSSESSED